MTKKAGTGFVGVVFMAILAGACSTIRRDEARNTGDLLVAAGFKMKPADTPARTEKLASMPALKMVQREKDGRLVFTYADPYNCKCLYVGDETAYGQYKRLALQKQIANEQLEASMAAEDATMDWGLWGPWW
jgi:hypothetical protein